MERRLDAAELAVLWLVPTLTYGVGDLLTTMTLTYGVPWLREGNPVVVAVFDAGGTAGFAALKIAVLVLGLSVAVRAARDDDRLSYYATPAFLALLGAALTVHNLRLLVA
jgi:hypothetical protein